MTARQFAEWVAYYGIEPFGEDWKQTGEIASLLYNAHRSSDARASTPADFMPIRRDEAELTGDQLLAAFDFAVAGCR
jgi:hypothetical protein